MIEPQKICSKCKIGKPLDQFNFRSKSNNKRHSYCKECGKILTRNHYKKAKPQYLKRNLKYYSKRRQIVIDAKKVPCADCGVEYPYYVMDFDHREGVEKKLSLNSIHHVTIKAILEEIAKCDVVCANCHRERTFQRMRRKISPHIEII